MKKRISIILFFLLIGLLFVVPVFGKTSNGFVLEGADDSNTFTITSSQTLLDLVSSIGTRIVLEYADGKNEFAINLPPSELSLLLNQIAPRFILEYSDKAKFTPLTYPKSIINDTNPPVITNVTALDTDIITWTTDEYSTSTVIYGINTVGDIGEISNSLFTKQHNIPLPGLTPGITYKYQVRSTDRSGNTSTSNTYSYTPKVTFYIYLPLVIQ
jgi:hypothetical protein